jgi:hypothetical protein
MAVAVMIGGESGTGKSSSIRTMNPNLTSIINVQGKPLPFRTAFPRTKNTDSYADITAAIQQSSSPSIVIDDAQYLLANDFMRKAKVAGYEKYTDLALSYFNLIKAAIALPADRVVSFMSHIDRDSQGNEKIKTIGKLLDEKICVEGMFTIVLKTVVQDGRFYFATVNNGMDTVKTPFDMFSSPLIPNDLKFVDDSIRSYYGIEINTAPVQQAGNERAREKSLV